MSASPSSAQSKGSRSNKFELSIDANERFDEEEARRTRSLAADAKKGIAPEKWIEVDYKKKALDAKHIRALADLMAYLFFLFFIFCVVFLNPAEMHANKVISALDSQLNPSTVTSVAGLWNFLALVTPQAHQTQTYNGEPYVNASAREYQPYFFGPGNMALGKIRLRQLRLQESTCEVAEAFAGHIQSCNAPMTTAALQRSGTYAVTGVFNSDYEVHGDGYSWYSGTTKVLYPSEGFVVELPLKALDASNYLAKLEANDWIDERTRAVFLEFSVYNVHVDHFAAVRYAFELLPSGLVVGERVLDSVPLLSDVRVFMNDGYPTQALVLVMFEFLLYAMVLFYLTKVADIAAKFANLKTFLSDAWNFLDMLNLASFAGLVMTRAAYMLRSAALSYDVYHLADDDLNLPVDIDDKTADYSAYFRVRQTIEMWRVGRSLLAVGVFVNFARAFKFVRASKKLSSVSDTLAETMPEVSNLMFIFLVLFCGFALAFRLLVATSVAGYADFTDSCFSLMGIVLGDLGQFQSLLEASPKLFPVVLVLLIVSCNFVMLTLLLKSVDSAYQTVQERQKFETDHFVEELREAALLLVRETYWRITAPYQMYRAQKHIQTRMKDGRSKARLEAKQAALASSSPGSGSKGGSGSGRFTGAAALAGGAALASAAGDTVGAASQAGKAASAALTAVGSPTGGRSDGSDIVPSEMERLNAVKTKVASGRFVGEDEVKANDIAETVAYLAHRQGVLLKRLQALAAYVDGAAPPDPEEVPDSDDEDTLDPTADPATASGYSAAVDGGGGGRSSLAPQLVARPNPPAVANAASGRTLAAGPTPAAAVGAAALAGMENASTPAGTDSERAAQPDGPAAAVAVASGAPDDEVPAESGADASNSDAHAEPRIEQTGPLLDQEVGSSPSGEAESKGDGEGAELL